MIIKMISTVGGLRHNITHHRVRGARPRSDTNVFIEAPASTFVSPSAFWLFPGSNMALTDAVCMLVPWHMSRA